MADTSSGNIQTGQVVGGKFRIDAKLGEGGMGAVYRAWDVTLDRPVALKVIRPELAQDASFLARFKREAKAAARLRHPAVIEIFEYSDGKRTGGLLYMAFEFLDGARELSELIRKGQLTPRRTIWILSQVLSALDAAHRAGIVHRDLKPQNIMVEAGPEERIKILDFGIAKLKNADSGLSMNVITMAGQVMGTVYYMSPEQAEGGEIDERTDLYAVGVMLFLMLAGKLPFKAPRPFEIMEMHRKAPVPDLEQPHLASFQPLINRAMAKRPEDRFQTAGEFRAALEALVGATTRRGLNLEASDEIIRLTPPPTGHGSGGGVTSSRLQQSSFKADTPTQSFPTPTSGARAAGSGATHSAYNPATTPPGTGARPGYEAGETHRFFANLIGRSVGKYQIESKLGMGGMGAVFRARDKLLGRTVALKVVHPHLGNNKEIRRRFLREARAALEFTHPNAIATRDCDVTSDGLLYMTQDYSPGVSLRVLLGREGRLPTERALAITRQALLALNEAHRKGIVHRDLKPENMLVEQDAQGDDLVKVCDFGIAKILDAQAEGSESLTAVGEILGTPHYMAPEQAEGLELDGRADLYAMGCVLYELLTGGKPFDAKTLRQIVLMHMGKPPEPPRQRATDANIPPAVEAIVLKAMEKDAANRYASADAFIHAIDALGYTLAGARTRTYAANAGSLGTTVAPHVAKPAEHSGKIVALVGGLAILVVSLIAGGALLVYKLSNKGPIAKVDVPPVGDGDAAPQVDSRALAEAQRKLEEERREAADRAELERRLAEERREAREEAEAARRLEEEQHKAREEDEAAQRLERERRQAAALAEAERKLKEARREAEAARKLAEEQREAAELTEAERRREEERRKAEALEDARRQREEAALTAEELAKAKRRVEEERRRAEEALRLQRIRTGVYRPDGSLELQRGDVIFTLHFETIPAQKVEVGPRPESVGPLEATREPMSFALYARLAEVFPPGKALARHIKPIAEHLSRGKGSFVSRLPRALKPQPVRGIPRSYVLYLAQSFKLRLPSTPEAFAIVAFRQSEDWIWTAEGEAVGLRRGRPFKLASNPEGWSPTIVFVR